VSGNFARAFGISGVPETFVINRQGKIVALLRSQLDGTWLKQTLPRVLAEAS
jgi:cytochrome c biogenesis protein CcmG/thiol:disulfide interchange protein DsbE